MSYEAAVGQIAQILQWQQQLLDPAATTQTSATGGAGLTSATGAGAGTGFADALAQAQSGATAQAGGLADPAAAGSGTLLTGATGSAGMLDSGNSQLVSLLSSIGGTATTTSDPRVAAMVQEANSLVGKPYVWGGGHGGWGPQAGYDCSGFVSAVLHAGGYLSNPQDTTSLPSAAGIEQGSGQHVTIYDRSQPGENGHVIIEIDGQFYESGGEQASWGGGGGVERIATPSAAYLSTFDTILHPAGL